MSTSPGNVNGKRTSHPIPLPTAVARARAGLPRRPGELRRALAVSCSSAAPLVATALGRPAQRLFSLLWRGVWGLKAGALNR